MNDEFDDAVIVFADHCGYPLERPQIVLGKELNDTLVATVLLAESHGHRAEFAFALTAERTDNGWHVLDMHLLPAKASPASFEDAFGAGLTPSLADKARDLLGSCDGILHVHPAGITGFSSVDKHQLNPNFDFSLVVTRNLQYRGVVRIEVPCGALVVVPAQVTVEVSPQATKILEELAQYTQAIPKQALPSKHNWRKFLEGFYAPATTTK